MKRLRQNLRPRSARAGFTLIELMIVVAIMGVLSAIAIPAFRVVLFRAKSSEASANLASLFKGAAAYYVAERGAKGQGGALLTACTVADPATRLPLAPQRQKQVMPSTDPSFNALGFSVGDYVYYAYGFSGRVPTSECDVARSSNTVYTLYANGNLDGDSITSTFELAVGSDVNNELYHARGLHIIDELE